MRISDWSSDVCSSDLFADPVHCRSNRTCCDRRRRRLSLVVISFPNDLNVETNSISDSRMDHFLHGGEYPETQGIRTEACSSCAFVNSPRTVRTPDITIPELIRQTAEFDDFVCHTAECGKTKPCRRWHDAHHKLRGRKSTRLNSSHYCAPLKPSSAIKKN